MARDAPLLVATRVFASIDDTKEDKQTGGLGMHFKPSTTSHVLDDTARQAETDKVGRVFDAPCQVVIHEVDAGHMFMTTCERRCITAISSEVAIVVTDAPM